MRRKIRKKFENIKLWLPTVLGDISSQEKLKVFHPRLTPWTKENGGVAPYIPNYISTPWLLYLSGRGDNVFRRGESKLCVTQRVCRRLLCAQNTCPWWLYNSECPAVDFVPWSLYRLNQPRSTSPWCVCIVWFLVNGTWKGLVNMNWREIPAPHFACQTAMTSLFYYLLFAGSVCIKT